MGAHFWPKYKIKEGFFVVFFHPLNIVELSKKIVCVQEANLGKVAKFCTAQIKGSIFFKINQNYLAHIFPEYGFRVILIGTPSLHYNMILCQNYI